MHSDKKSSKLKKMRMPEMEPEMEMSDAEEMDMEMAEPEASELAEKPEAPESDDAEGVEPEPMASLEEASDEDLMAEIRKRGLMSELEKSEEMEPESDIGVV
jgi:hypothetical protein